MGLKHMILPMFAGITIFIIFYLLSTNETMSVICGFISYCYIDLKQDLKYMNSQKTKKFSALNYVHKL